MNFQIYNLDNGRVNTCDLSNLSRSLMVNCEIIVIDGDKVEAIGFVNHHLLTFFATEFADYALKNYEYKPNPEAESRVSLIKKWLNDPSSVSNEELRFVANNSNSANAASAAAHAVVYIACYAGNNSTSNPVAYAADACADAAANTAYAAKNKEEEFIRQGKFILDFFSSNDKIEA